MVRPGRLELLRRHTHDLGAGRPGLFEVFYHPDISALWAETVEEQPLAVGRPDRIVNATFTVGEFVHFRRFARCDRRYPDRLVPHYIHEERIVRRERHMGTADDFTVERNGVVTANRHLIRLGLPAARTPEGHVGSVARPAQEMS